MAIEAQGVNENLKAILDRLDALGAKLQVTGLHLWEVLVKQQAIMATYHYGWAVASIIAGLVFGGVGLVCGRKLIRLGTDDGDYFVGGVILLAATLIVTSAFVGSGIDSALNGYMHAMNPEFYALREIIK